jgi:hypothetical protein
MKTLCTVTLALLLMGGIAVAGQVVDRTATLPAGGEVDVEMIAGTIRIIGQGGSEVTLTGTIGDGSELEFDADAEGVFIEVAPIEGRDEDMESSDLEIRLPSGARIEVELISGNVEVSEVDGALDIEVISGNIELRCAPSVLDVETISGNVVIVSGGVLRDGDIEAVSGEVEIETSLGSDSSLDIETVSGNVTLMLTGDASASFDLETFNGDIRTDFGYEAKKSSPHLPAQELSFTLGSGAGDVSIETINGTIRIKKR